MITTTESQIRLNFSQDDFEAFLAGRTEPVWLTTARRESWNRFLQMDWPGRRDEEWVRTDIRLFKLDHYALPLSSTSPGSEGAVTSALNAGVTLGGQVAGFNGCSTTATLDSHWVGKGVVFGPLDQVVKSHGDLVKKYLFAKAVDPTIDRFAALHAAAWSSGMFLYVPRGVTLSQPLHTMATLSDGGVDLGHTLVVLEDGAAATMLCETNSLTPNGDGFHCGATEIIMGKGAHLRFVNLQDWSNGVWHFAHQKAVLDSDAQLQWTIAALGSRLSKVNQHVALVGPGAGSQVNGVMFTEGRQHLSYHTLQHHVAPHCHSDFLYKGALQDKSRTVWRGMIKVGPNAQKTDGYQRNDSLLLSNSARADSIPGLEIEADDVRCTHGSTTGRVNEEMIFYAGCRGFTRQEAIRVIVSGFFQQIFDRVTIESVREALGLAISRRVREYD